ncbi:MAG TPA: hypothetical protein VMM56_04575 [Planctomycetaceae bacterium]|nr:hypothetical protein [Planctomycetaceae bacterium]
MNTSRINRYAMLSIAFQIFHYLFVLAGLDSAFDDLHIVVLDFILYFNIPFSLYLCFAAAFGKRSDESKREMMWPLLAVVANILYWLTIRDVFYYFHP